ncbi:arylsulfotransferase family protein [Halocatena pleomorpha]|uniref:Arylsulfotransferase (Asst) n=1 Tax=Halocatena pleomorpha TaxID=1785090 RepID=A0A3P3RK41_9EURY|nr:arylsulfotransferase family protein [Halocatena pleomorpha]RRJ33755.1 arylsulfotransferase (asst) [Halocatena pleomorpha]
MIDRWQLSRGGVRSALSRNRLRAVFVVALLFSAAVLATAASGGVSTASKESTPNAPPTDNHTVVTESGRHGTITAYAPNGEIVYYNDTHTKYFDVDPVAENPMVVEYTATDTIHTKGPTCSDPPCAKNVLERVNLKTGEVDVLYERYDHQETAGEWHDAVRINGTHVLIADILDDQVFIVDTETEIIEWLWDAQSDYPVDGGGPYPHDWAHINDVEYIENGTNAGKIMVSLRNQDQVAFIDPETGLQENWTLGAEDNYSTMFEQHNPDYIPASRGGPAVVVADSENGRIQEFQRNNGSWVRSWEWSDEQMQWPRDADRLPNSNTLVTDTHGNRVMEIAPNGAIEWQVESTLPYEAERLETGVESTKGKSAETLGYESRTADNATAGDGDGFSPLDTIADGVQSVVPHRITNGILFVSPVWMGTQEFAVVAFGLLVGLTWITLEIKWQLHDRRIGFRFPLYRDEKN